MVEKWSVNRLSDETGKDRRTVKKILERVAPVDETPSGPVYALRDFMDAWLAYESPDSETRSLEVEKTRLTKAQADIAEVQRAKIRNEVLDTETVFRTWENVAMSIRRTVLTSGLPEQEKDSILAELESVTLADYLEQKEFTEGEPSEGNQ